MKNVPSAANSGDRNDMASPSLDETATPAKVCDPVCAGDPKTPPAHCEVAQARDQAEARLRLAQEAAGIGIWDFDPASRKMQWSAEQFALHGMPVSVEAPDCRAWLDIVESTDRVSIVKAERSLLSRHVASVRLEFRIRRQSDGVRRWLLSLGRLVATPAGEARIVGVNFDVTDLRQTEDLLRHTGELLRLAQSAVGIGLWEFDLDERRAIWSVEQFALYGLDAQAPAPGYEAWLAMVHIDDRAMIHRAQRDLAAGRTQSLQAEFRVTRANDGAARWLACMGRMVSGQAGTRRMAGVTFDVTGLRQTEAALRHSEAMFRATFEQAAVGMAFVDLQGRVLRVNQRLCDLLGYTREEALKLNPRAVTYPEDLAPSVALYEQFMASGAKAYRIDKRYMRKDGAPLWVTLTVSMLYDASGQERHCLAVVEDLTQRKTAEIALQESEARARRLFDGAPLPNYLVDPLTSEIVDSNEAATAMLGYTREELRGMTLADVDVTETGLGIIPQHLRESDEPVQFETRHRTRSGEIRDVVIAVVPVHLPGRRLAHGTVIDISDRKRAEANLKNQAETDGLTGLASRNWFFTALETVLFARAPTARRAGALILVDIDYFKQVNDTLGHDAGDGLLVEIGRRLRTKCRAEDIPARLGGDEFALLIPGIRDERAIAARMADILGAMAQPVDLEGRILHVTVSLGATHFPRDGAGPKDLLKHADLALYEAKRAGRGCWRFFRPEQAEVLERHVRMADALRAAIDARAIQIALQPKRRLNGTHAGFEALARWHDGERWVPPDEFVPIAEATGLIRPLGRQVMDMALARIKSLRSKTCDPGHVAVNVSSADLLDPDFVAQVRSGLRRYRLSPADLELEVTETVLLGRTADLVDSVLRELRALGISIALDDFGTGFASLAHISRLAVDRLKIDRSFVSDIGNGRRAGLIARTIIALARDLEIESVAEGVETPEQLAFLAAEGCDAAQGYLIARPLQTEAEAAAYLMQTKIPHQNTKP
jgi:diguanylate cyclase (GGDEF)-like protein/PAS domain S-box-containing protein